MQSARRAFRRSLIQPLDAQRSALIVSDVPSEQQVRPSGAGVIADNSPSQRAAGFRRDLYLPLLTALFYYLGAEAAFFVGTLSDQIFAPFWPPNIVLFCALLLTPYRQWWLYFLAAFPAHVIAELGVGMHWPQLLVAFTINCLVATMNAVGVRYALGGPPWFGSLRKACLYVLITVIVSPMIAGLGGAFDPAMGAGSFERYWAFYTQWYLSNAVGSIALGPIALILLSERHRWSLSASPRRIIEAAVLALILVVVCAIAFETGARVIPSSFLPALIYSPLPLVLWAAIRFGAKGASGAILLVAVVLIARALNGPSLFLSTSPETSVLAIQMFLLGLSIPVLLLGAAIDETRHAEQAVRESEERMTFAAVSADVCLWQINYRSGRFWITEHGREMLGLDPQQPITWHTVINTIHPEDRQQAVDSMQASAATNALVDCEFRVVRSDGQILWVRCRARSHGDSRGEPVQITGTFANITDRKAAETELVRQRQEIAHLMRVSTLAELSGGIAHELTQPLTAILANAEAAKVLIIRSSPNLAEVVEALDDIIEEDNRAGEVIHRVRGLLKKSEAKFEAVNLNDVVTSTLRLLNHEFVSRHIKIRAKVDPTLAPVLGDAIQLQQVLLNLVINAIDAVSDVAPTQRTITVRTRNGNAGEILIEVSDSGVGLKPGYQGQLFQPFVTTKERGLGLGLSLCSAIVKLHGGALNLHNNAQVGATATFTLPALSTQEEAAE